MIPDLEKKLQEITNILYVEDHEKYDLMYNLVGGLGDIINKLFFTYPLYEYLVEQLKYKKIIINLCSANPFSKEIFDYFPNKNNLKINVFDNFYTIISSLDYAERENFFQNFTKNNINLNNDNYEFLKELPKSNGYVDFYINSQERIIIDDILKFTKKDNKKIILFCPCSGKKYTTIPKEYSEKIIEYVPDGYVLLKIGRDYATFCGEDIRYNTEYKFTDSVKIKDFTNKLSVPATLELAKICTGIITTDSSMMCYGSILQKPMLLMLFDKNHHIFRNYKKHMHYFRCFEYSNVVVEDWLNMTKSTIDKFINFL